nr:ATP-binding protein [Candidatus Solincola tengchongensis]
MWGEGKGKSYRDLLEELAVLREKAAELEEAASRARKAEEKERREHEQLLAILDSIDEIIYVSDPFSYEILYVNQTLKNRFGKDPTGGLCYREFQGRDAPCDFCTNPVILEEPDKPYSWEYHNPLLDRDYIIVDRLIHWPDGRPVRFELALDVTELKRAEESLNILEKEVEGIYRAAPVGIGTVSYPDRVIKRVNPRLCEMLGYREEELTGKSARMLYASEEEYMRVGEQKYRKIEESGIGSIETKWVTRDGKILDILLSSTYLDPSDPYRGTVFTAVDLTEMKKMREYRERADRVILGLGADAMENMVRILEGMREILGCDHAAYYLRVRGQMAILSTLSGEERFIIFPEGSEEGSLCTRYLREGRREPLAFEDLSGVPGAERDPLVSGHAFHSCLLFPVTVRGRVAGCLAAYHRVERGWSPEEVEAAEMLARALSLEQERLQREEELKDFIDVASHELRHPATVIKGYAVTLRERWDELGEKERMRMFRALKEGADRLARMSGMLLDVSRMERGRFRPEKGEVNPLSLVEEAVGEMRGRGFAHRFRVSAFGTERRLEADKERIRQLMCILLENAALYSPPDSVIDVELSEKEGELLVSVLDRGMGIPEEDRERVFERFYQVEDALHHSMPGMGMGLYIAREIVEGHGGRIWNESRPGGGTAFRFTLPLTGNR